LGVFVWQWAACESCLSGDAKTQAIISKCKRCNISWLALHMEDVTTALVKILHDAGLYVACWKYCVPGTNETADFIHHAVLCRESGCDAVLPDCEIEWETLPAPGGGRVPGDRRAEAATFANQLRSGLKSCTNGDCPIGNCGAWQWPSRHPGYPDKEFGAVFDFASPERYWTMFSPSEPAASALDESEKEWSSIVGAGVAGGYPGLIPIGSAFDGSAQGGQPLRPADITEFLNRVERGQGTSVPGTCALWSFQHIPPAIWALLESRAAARVSTVPPPVT
jgi:hypothetical protein